MQQIINKINEKILEISKKGNKVINGMLITNSSNIKYILKNEIEGYVYVEENNIYVITDSRYIELASSICNNENSFVINLSDNNHVNQCLELFKDKVIGIEAKDITIYLADLFKQRYNIKEFVNLIDVIEDIRQIKTNEEIENIKKACEITDKGFEYMIQYIKPGMTEKQIKDELEYFMKKNGADDIAFDSVVASGPNSSKPHAVPGDKIIQVNDIVLLDFGCKYNGYCSDMTRTIFVGDITQKQKEIYNIVLKAQLKAIDCVKENVNVKDIDNIVRDEFRKYDLEENYLHSTGHGVGLDIHEQPAVSNRYDCNLKQGMIITIEPGIYFQKDFGVRIEDTVLVTEDGCEILFSSSKDITCIK